MDDKDINIELGKARGWSIYINEDGERSWIDENGHNAHYWVEPPSQSMAEFTGWPVFDYKDPAIFAENVIWLWDNLDNLDWLDLVDEWKRDGLPGNELKKAVALARIEVSKDDQD